MRNITEIIIHCTATPEGKDYSVEQIRKWHQKRASEYMSRCQVR